MELPPGLVGPQSGARPGPRATARPSLAETLRTLDKRVADGGTIRGAPSGTTQQMGALAFDPQGADFTSWVSHFRNEVYRNWIVPPAVVMGMSGHVDIELTVGRDGRVTKLVIEKSTGNPALDRAAANALLSSRLLPLPADYAPPQLVIQVTMSYNVGPEGS